jgi:hypothetical protein
MSAFGDGCVDRRVGDRAVCSSGTGAAAQPCRRPVGAWRRASPGGPVGKNAEALLRLARRSASSGTALAQGVAELADQSRHEAADAASAAAERASVLIAGPLGLCYLPAFVCLGIIPVVAGLAGDVLRSGIL